MIKKAKKRMPQTIRAALNNEPEKINNDSEKMESIQNVMRNIFDDDSLIINYQTSSADIDEWDSFSNIHLLTAIERQFQIKFTTPEAMSIKNVGDIVRLLDEKAQQR